MAHFATLKTFVTSLTKVSYTYPVTSINGVPHALRRGVQTSTTATVENAETHIVTPGDEITAPGMFASEPGYDLPSPADDERRFLKRDPLLSQLVNTIMRDGKKARAETLVGDALKEIRRQTNSDPVAVLHYAIERASPLMKLRPFKKGSKVVQVPVPLNERQRRRAVIVWILEAADKRNEKGFSLRLSGEILAVVNGASNVLLRKEQVHKQAVANRSYAQIRPS